MLIRFWRATRDEDGQAIVIAAVGLLVVSMVVLATATLGNAIHEKVRLQNATDAATYSTAAAQARAFNFYAFTNRTMVSHYVAIMLLQSYLVVATFIYSAINTILSLVSILGAPCDNDHWGCQILCELMRAIPYVGPFLAAVSEIMNAIASVLLPISEAIKYIIWGEGMFRGLDWLVGWVAIPAFVAANWTLYLAQYAMMIATTFAVLDGGMQVVEESYSGTGRDPPSHGAALGGVAGPAALFNLTQWNRAHDPEALNATPLGAVSSIPGMPDGSMGEWRVSDWLAEDMHDVDDGIQRAQRIMTEISNATRWNNFVFDRSLDDTLVGGIVEMINTATMGLFDFRMYGETKMLTESWPDHDVTSSEGFELHDIRSNVTRAGHTYMPQGGSVVGDQWLRIDLLFGYYDMTESALGIDGIGALTRRFTPKARQSAVAASHRDFSPDDRWGWHCATHLKEEERWLGFCKAKLQYIDRDASACDAPEPNEAEGGNHPWWGITPFMKFNPSADPSAGTDFHQPNTFVWLHQDPENIDRDPLMQRMVFNQRGHEAELDTSVEGEGEIAALAGDGFHSIARGMTYYHRPGNWNEHPNFFNPYWRAKLEPISPLLTELTAMFGAEMFGDLIGQRLFTH